MRSHLRPISRSGVAALLAIAASGCGSDEPAGAASGSNSKDDRVAIATTVAPITSIAANIGGDRVSITGIVPEGTNSHTF